jgi:drug/metabolite transporter (DMT)-like permease
MDAETAAQTPLIIVFAVAALASISLNLGKAVQKMKVEVLRQGRKVLSAPHRRDFLIWCLGISLTFVAGVLTIVAQKLSDKTSLVSSLNGVGLVGLALFAWLVLKEKVGLRECAAMALIIGGTAAVSYFNRPAGGEKYYNFNAMLLCCGATSIFFAIAISAALKTKRGIAFIFAAFAGCGLAMANIFYHITPTVAPGGTFVSQFKTAYPWIGFLILGNLGFLFTNLAFFHGAGITVVPTVNSFMIVMPMVYEIPIFHTTLAAPQYTGAAVIIAGVLLLTTAPENSVSRDAQKPRKRPAAP